VVTVVLNLLEIPLAQVLAEARGVILVTAALASALTALPATLEQAEAAAAALETYPLVGLVQL
jgi:hypothetical protein